MLIKRIAYIRSVSSSPQPFDLSLVYYCACVSSLSPSSRNPLAAPSFSSSSFPISYSPSFAYDLPNRTFLNSRFQCFSLHESPTKVDFSLILPRILEFSLWVRVVFRSGGNFQRLGTLLTSLVLCIIFHATFTAEQDDDFRVLLLILTHVQIEDWPSLNC